MYFLSAFLASSKLLILEHHSLRQYCHMVLVHDGNSIPICLRPRGARTRHYTWCAQLSQYATVGRRRARNPQKDGGGEAGPYPLRFSRKPVGSICPSWCTLVRIRRASTMANQLAMRVFVAMAGVPHLATENITLPSTFEDLRPGRNHHHRPLAPRWTLPTPAGHEAATF